MASRRWPCVVVCLVLLHMSEPPLRAATHVVPAGGDLQAALNAAQPGDTILLQAGAEYVGNFVLPAKSGEGYIVLRSSTPDGMLPGAGYRITPAHTPLLPRLRSNNTLPALRTASGARHWKLQYLEFAANHKGYDDIIRLGDGSSAQSSLSQIPHHFILEHLYVHGDPLLGQKRGIAVNVAHFELRDSYISDIKAVGQDTQAVGGWNGPGPFIIENNFLEAAGENVMFGGAYPHVQNLVPQDIVIRRNLISRPMAWKNPIIPTPSNVNAAATGGGALPAGTYAYRVFARRPVGQTTIGRSSVSAEASATVEDGGAVQVSWDAVPDATEYRVYGRTPGGQTMYWRVTDTAFVDTGAAGTPEVAPTSAGTMWTVKNLFELKSARSVLVDSNIFENHWKQAQAGYAIVYTPRSSGGCSWCIVENVTFQNNLVRNVSAGVNILGYDDTAPTGQANTLVFRQNLFVMRKSLGGNAWFMQLGDGPRDITVEHNTIDGDGTTVVYVYGGTSTDPAEVFGFRMSDNAARHGSYGMNGAYFSYGLSILANFYPGYAFTSNYLAGAPASRYPSGTLVSGLFADQFTDVSNGNYKVRSDSVLFRAASDGTDVGVDFDQLLAAIQGVEEGVPSTGSNSTNEAPLAGFSYTCSGLTCSFSDQSSDADGSVVSWSWTFNDGAPSTLKDPTHSFAASGTYAVTLTVTDDDGATASATQTIGVAAPNAPPAAAFTSSCSYLTCAFTDASTDEDGTIISRAWSFGDGASGSGTSPSHTFGAPGTYSVSLTVTDDDGASGSVTRDVTVTAPPAPLPPPPPPPPAGVHIGDLAGVSVKVKTNWRARVTVTVHSSNETPLPNAKVRFFWNSGSILKCSTNTRGQCTVTSTTLPPSTGSILFTVQSIESTAGQYNPLSNHDANGDSNGTTITVNRQ